MLRFNSSIQSACLFLVMVSFGVLKSQAQQSTRPTWPSAPDTARIQFVGFIAQSGDVGAERSFLGKIWDVIVGSEAELDFLVQPVGIAVDSLERIFVADPGAACVHVFDRKEEDYEKLTEVIQGNLVTPIGVACSAGRIYVTDASLKKIVVYDEDFDPIFMFDSGMLRPTGIAVRDGLIYISDTGEHRIAVFDLEGHSVGGFGKRGSNPGEFNFPVFLTVKENLLVVDALNHRVQTLTPAGTFVSEFGMLGTEQGTFASPKGIAVDSDGNIYVSDALFDAFQIFDAAGQLLLVVGESGGGPGQFQSPSGIAIDQNDFIYVVDTLNRRVQLFQYLGKPE
ncbi:MAG: 6-bladed beta-propeller [Bacteroidota bacterium]